MPQEEELKRTRDEIARVKREIAILPEERRIPYETRLAELERTEAELEGKLARETLRHLAGEVEHLRHEMGLDLEEIRAHIANLTARVKERIKPEEVAEVGRMVADMEMFLSGLMLPWRKELAEAREESELWKGRIERGEAILVDEVIGRYAAYRSYYMPATGETWVQTTPLH